MSSEVIVKSVHVPHITVTGKYCKNILYIIYTIACLYHNPSGNLITIYQLVPKWQIRLCSGASIVSHHTSHEHTHQVGSSAPSPPKTYSRLVTDLRLGEKIEPESGVEFLDN